MSACRVFFFSFLSLLLFRSGDGAVSLEPNQNLSVGGDLSLALDSFRSLPDGSWGGNMGAFLGLNLGFGIPKQTQGFGFQAGGSYGLYDWDGRGSTDSKSLQQESFFSLGLPGQPPFSSGENAGLLFDWQANVKAGEFGLNPSMGQMRGQLGYLFCGGNEVGLLATYDTGTSSLGFKSLPIEFRAISQVNAFWSHLFKNKGKLMFWGGTPYRKGLMFPSGRAGSYIIGASFKAPLTHSLSLEGHGMYMGARSGSADIESQNYAANVSLGLTYSFGGKKGGARPYMPLANNSNFLVDTNINY